MSDINPVSTPSTDIVGDWAETDRQHAALAESIRPANKAALFAALVGAGITTVVVLFDGSCDSGQIERVEAMIGKNSVNLPDVKIEIAQTRWGSSEITRSALPIREAIEQLAYDFLEETHRGWENDDGAYGEFTFNVAGRAITLDYSGRYVCTDYYQHVF